MTRHAKALLCLLLFALCGGLWLFFQEPEVAQDSIVTAEGIVTDRAISDGIPYISVDFPDGSAICCWVLHRGTQIPETVSIGDTVSVTYGTETGKGRFALLQVEEIG